MGGEEGGRWDLQANGLIFCRCVLNWFVLPVIGSTLMPNLITQQSAYKSCFRE